MRGERMKHEKELCELSDMVDNLYIHGRLMRSGENKPRYYGSDILLFPNEVYTRPDDPNKIDPEVMRFVNGQFCATKEWQKDVLERQPHVYPEDIGIEAIDPCPQCGYKTGSYKDMQAHYRSHM